MKSLIKLTIKIILLALFFNTAILCQQDSLQTGTQTNDTMFVMTKSPWGAVLRSAVLPGWGQYYNESYWKVPVVWGIMGWLVYNWVENNNLYSEYRTKYADAYNSTDAREKQLASTYERDRNFYRDQRDLFTIYFALTYVLNLVDAYVDAHLFDFTVEENLFHQPMMGVKINF